MALVAAALLVAYLQHQFAEEQRQQTNRILQQVSERTVLVLIGQLRQLFEAPVPATIEQIDHVALLEYRLAALGPVFTAGLTRHPFIERFFVWSDNGPMNFRDQVLFFRPAGEAGRRDISITAPDGRNLGGLFSDPAVGREIARRAREQARLKRNFSVLSQEFNEDPYQVIVHYQWEDVERQRKFALVGYTVNLRMVRDRFLSSVLSAEQARPVSPDPHAPLLEFSAVDDRGVRGYGHEFGAGTPVAAGSVEMLFFPASMLSWLNRPPNAPRWQLMVGVTAARAVPSTQRYRLATAVIFLIGLALFCAVAVHRQSTRLTQMHTDFVANVTHQLKTPLSILSAASETLRLKRVRAPEKIKDYAEVVHGQAERLSALVEQILLFSQLESPSGGREFTRVELSEVVRRSIVRFGTTGTAGRPSIKLQDSVEPLIVDGDPDALEAAVVNLLDNALKYGGPDEVVVSIERVESHAVVGVRDRGTGIDAADQKRIFERFYRGRQNAHNVRGFGLGLSIVQHIVLAHHGRIAVRSEAGEGTEFRLSLPAVRG